MERDREKQERERELEKERQDQALHNHFEKSLRAAQQKVLGRFNSDVLVKPRNTIVTFIDVNAPRVSSLHHT